MRAAVVLCLVAGASAGCGGSATEVERPVLLVSGRDDHGLVVQKTVGLSDWVGGEPFARVPDGTLVQVESTHGEWTRVQALERTSARGWVNDYYLRGTAHLIRPVAPFPLNAQVELLALDGSSLQVRALKTKRVAWVPRAAVAELPTR